MSRCCTGWRITTVVHVCHLLMLLSVTVLCHPLVHLTLCVDYPALHSLLYNTNGVSQSFFCVSVTRTQAYTPGQPGACLHSQPSGERGGKTQKKPLAFSMYGACTFAQQWTHTITPITLHVSHLKMPNTLSLLQSVFFHTLDS